MEFDLPSLNNKDRYKLLTSTIIPRPIALVSTIDEDGTLNCAPYSFFNAFPRTRRSAFWASSGAPTSSPRTPAA